MGFKYRMVRVVCKGKIKYCDFCKDIPFSEGYCKACRRPLWRKEGETCNTIICYYKGDLKQGNEQIGIDVICKECNSITSF